MAKATPKTEEQDRRVRKTRQQLRDALVNLILERGWDAISVQDICARADVGRSTFYVHFADKEELLLAGLEELHEGLDLQRMQATGSFTFVDGLVEHAKEKARLLRAIVGKRSSPNIQRRFREVVMQLVAAELSEFELDEKQQRAIINFVGAGLAELITSWLDRPSSIDTDTLSAMGRQLANSALSSFTRKSARNSRQSRK
ncbi:MAG TPA: TetR/AcrR family transcriptional regulator [Polyangiaceae bacterium]|nr:TetR/AcrR family transcriptional regulator [Polyangiaceae bacterium]